jgi:putative transposase
MERPERHRRSIRLPGADYTEAGGYFITICAANRREICGTVQHGQIFLNALGNVVLACLVQIPNHFANAELKEFVVMPNHVHAIIALHSRARYIVPLSAEDRTIEKFQKPVHGSIPTIVRTFKAAVARCAGKELRMEKEEIWQRNYLERVLRDGQEYADASRYIVENPRRWEWDEENPSRKLQAD